MKLRAFVAVLAIVLTGLVSAPSVAAPSSGTTSFADRHACTHTSSGSCIRGGQFCPQKSYGHSGWDAQGRRYVCKGSRSHPHWMKP